MNNQILFLIGERGIGKTEIALALLRLKHEKIKGIWISCKELDIDTLLYYLNDAFDLEIDSILSCSKSLIIRKISRTLAKINEPAILILDQFEHVLDEDGQYSPEDFGHFLEILRSINDRIKLIITTPILPRDMQTSVEGVQFIDIQGLASDFALDLFQHLSNREEEEIKKIGDSEVIRKFDGHPNFIGLVASRVKEMPFENMMNNLDELSNLAEFVEKKIFHQLNDEALKIIELASVFRDSFTLDDLTNIARNAAIDVKIDNELVRRIADMRVFVVVNDNPLTFFMHPPLRDIVKLEPAYEARIHASVSQWLLRNPVIPENPSTWKEKFYHLHKASELGKNKEYFVAYRDFIHENSDALFFAGKASDLIQEYIAILQLVHACIDDKGEQWLNVTLLLTELADLHYERGNTGAAIEIGKGIITNLPSMSDLDFDSAKLIAIPKLAVGNFLTSNESTINEAKVIATELESFMEKVEDIGYLYNYQTLLYEIARKERDPNMLNIANRCYELACALYQESPTIGNKSRIGKSWMKIGTASIWLASIDDVLAALTEALRIKVEIRNWSEIPADMFNLGGLYKEADKVRAGAMCMTSDQINREVEMIQPSFVEEMISELTNEFAKLAQDDPSIIEKGREIILEIDEVLLPYYERAIDRLNW